MWRRARQEEEEDGNEKDKESKDSVRRQLIRVGCFGKGGEQEKDSAAVIILGLEMIDDDDYAMAESSMFHLGLLRNWKPRSGADPAGGGGSLTDLDLGPWTWS